MNVPALPLFLTTLSHICFIIFNLTQKDNYFWEVVISFLLHMKDEGYTYMNIHESHKAAQLLLLNFVVGKYACCGEIHCPYLS